MKSFLKIFLPLIALAAGQVAFAQTIQPNVSDSLSYSHSHHRSGHGHEHSHEH